MLVLGSIYMYPVFKLFNSRTYIAVQMGQISNVQFIVYSCPIVPDMQCSSYFINVPASLGGNAHRILLQNEPIFTKFQEKTHNEGKQIWTFSSLIIFPVLSRWYFRSLLPILWSYYMVKITK